MPESSSLIRVLGYVRVSTEEQASEGLSMDFQRRKIRAFCELRELFLVRLVEDIGSGKESDRAGYQELLRSVKDPKIEGVVVFRLDRLSRSLLDLANLIDLFKKENAQLWSVMENIDASTPIGRFVIKLLGALAELEVDVLGERTKAGMEEAKRKGVHVGGIPLGKRLSGEDGRLEEDAEEAKTVKRIHELRIQGLSLRAIALCLNEEGHKTKRGGHWHPQTVKVVLDRISNHF